MAGRPKQLLKAQIGAESTWGTTVDQTAILNHITDMSLEPSVTTSLIPRLGNLANAVSAAVTKTGGEASITETANYGQLGLWLEGALGAATDGGAGPYTHTWQPTGAAAITRIFYTLAMGDSSDVYSLAGALVKEIKLTFTPGEPVKCDVSFVGKHVESDAFTGSLSDFTDSTQLLLPSEVAVAIDTIGGTLGSTVLNCDALSGTWTLTVETPIQYGLGTLSGCDYATTKIESKLELTAEFGNSTTNAAAEALLGASPTLTQRDIRLSFTKSANYSLVIDAPMTLAESPTYYDDEDGMLTIEMTWVTTVNSSSSTTSKFLDIVLTNQDATI